MSSQIYFVGVARHARNKPLTFEAAACASHEANGGSIPFEVQANQHMIATESEWEEGKAFRSLGFQWLLAKRAEWLYVVVGLHEVSESILQNCMHDLIQEWSPTSLNNSSGIDRCATILLRWCDAQDDRNDNDSKAPELPRPRRGGTSLRDSRNSALETARQMKKKQPQCGQKPMTKDNTIAKDSTKKRDGLPLFCGADIPMLETVSSFFNED